MGFLLAQLVVRRVVVRQVVERQLEIQVAQREEWQYRLEQQGRA
jgi:hypothetical protein